MRHASLATANGDRRRVAATSGLAGQGGDEIFPDLYRGMDNSFLRPASSVDTRPSWTRGVHGNTRQCGGLIRASVPQAWQPQSLRCEGVSRRPATRARRSPLESRGRSPLVAPAQPLSCLASATRLDGEQALQCKSSAVWRVVSAQKLSDPFVTLPAHAGCSSVQQVCDAGARRLMPRARWGADAVCCATM